MQAVIRSFADRGTEDIYNGEDTRAARKKCPLSIWKTAQRRLSVLDAAADLRDLKSPGAQLERLKDERKGQWSIRINDQLRICFYWTEQGAAEVEIVDYH